MIRELGLEASVALLRDSGMGRLGCCHDGEPYVVPINYLWDGDAIYVHSLPGLKIDVMRAHRRACIQVDEITDTYHWQSAIAFGEYEELGPSAERDRILGEFFKRLPNLTPVEAKAAGGDGESIVFKLRIYRITGVAEG